ncbi:MAG: hemerythrin domain-containing protein [Bacteroidota bacterium]
MNYRLENINYSEMSLQKLGVYVMDIQHPYLKKALSTFMLCTAKIYETSTSETNILGEELTKLGALIEEHLIWEEQTFFPFLRLQIEHKEYHKPGDFPELVYKLKSEHDAIIKLIKKNRLISNDYVPASDASPKLKLCYAQLFDFEQDILKHIFLEEDLLFPKLFNKTAP